MDFILLNEEQKLFYRNTLLDVVKDSDKDFVPPLSSRTNTTQGNLKGNDSSSKGVLDYFNQVMKQSILLILENDIVLGFVSFIEDMESQIITSKYTPNIYISTAMLSEYARGKGATTKAYNYLFNELYKDKNIFTRTWSTNSAHIHILEKFGFSVFASLKNDRGENIDTIYFSLIRDNKN